LEQNESHIPESNQNDQPPEELDDLQKKVQAYSEKQWTLIQRVAGVLLGLLSGFLLTYFGAFESTSLYGTIGALLIALLLPNMVEKRIKRSVQKGRIMLMIALGVSLVIYAVYMLASGVPIISKAA